MPSVNKVTFFASGNGDCVLLQAHGRSVMTDINYRAERCRDPDDDEAPDYARDIRKACHNDHLDVFVLTHPDEDHLRGFCEVFHLGRPEDWDDDPDDGSTKIIVDEIWCSPYGANPHYTTDTSKPVLDEIKRRKRLANKPEGEKPGNRLVILDTESHSSGVVAEGLSWRLLAPTPDEADIPKSDDPDKPNSSNPSSLVVRWTVSIGGKKNQILLGGDSTVEIWERVSSEVLGDDPDALAWHILLAPHHCSRRSIGRVENEGTADEEFVPSEKAEAALGEQRGRGFVVSSSRKVVRGGLTPPSFDAKNRYLRILAKGGSITEEERNRFACTGSEKDGKAGHLEFSLSAAGPAKGWVAAPASVSGGSASGRGGGYG